MAPAASWGGGLADSDLCAYGDSVVNLAEILICCDYNALCIMNSRLTLFGRFDIIPVFIYSSSIYLHEIKHCCYF